MYPSDFSAAEAVYTPSEGDLFLGVPPLLALALLLILLAVAVGAYLMGHRQAIRADGPGGDKAPDEIHKAILAASTAAMAASSDELKFRAQALRTAIHDHLGPVLELAKGVSGLAKALDDALKGEKTEPKKPDTPSPAPAPASHDAKGAEGCGCGQPKACSCARPSPPAITVTHFVVGGPPPACGCQSSHKPGCDHAAPKTEKPALEAKADPVPMTGPEQIDALSRAVRQFHDHWSRDAARVRELRQARDALCRLPTPPKSEPRRLSVGSRR
ncbi:hypothetical protein BZG35_17340 [Brevundimonas sp. LM2]|uniref:hypothetical protein n=1 Tax=Brevundimonas sp. LM2 TaxID=1938605 RepID=UPI0009839A36|nr:hypothetical protein [Brevundimonas sp. LM2]AQR63213.1 hypothetical protein BZG35_17340 [Brevundimonas sp. LM2]